MEENFELNYIRKLIDEICSYTFVLYDDLPNYDLFLSQVADILNEIFVDDKFTGNIIQNYIKDHVITKPKDGKKRRYTRTHLIQLILLGYMRPILTTEEIKKVFELAFNEINDMNDDILFWEDTYKTFMQMQKENLRNYIIPEVYEKVTKNILKKFNLKYSEKRIETFLLVIFLIAEASAAKKLTQRIIREYNLICKEEDR